MKRLNAKTKSVRRGLGFIVGDGDARRVQRLIIMGRILHEGGGVEEWASVH
jgi:hypothetical protein